MEINNIEDTIGRVVWAPYAGSEYRLRVVDVSDDGRRVTLKRPGSDAGTITVEAYRCYPTAMQPHSLEDIQ